MESLRRDSDFVVAVPSYCRETVIGSKTLALLARHHVPPRQVYIFVADEEERQRYVASVGDDWPNIVVGKPTLWRQRNFITDYFDEGCHVVSLDDDVEQLFRLSGEPLNGGFLVPLHDGGLVDIIKDAWNKMQQLGVSLWSLNVSDNPYFMKHGITMRNGLCNGFFWGCRVRKTPLLALQFGDGHEDVERTVRYLSMDGAVFRYREFCAKTRCKSNQGGLQASLTAKQRMIEEDKSADSLVHQFPFLLKRRPESKIGVKFVSPGHMVSEHFSCLTRDQFLKIAGQNRLNLLVGSRCICRLDDTIKSSRYSLCTIVVARSDVGLIGMASEAGQKFLTCTFDFADAVSDRLFFVQLPDATCATLNIATQSDACISHLSQALPNVQVIFTSDRHPPNLKRDFGNERHEDTNDFAKYLDSLACDDGSSSESEDEQTATSGDDKLSMAAGVVSKKRPANVESKRSNRHEDSEWVANQKSLAQSSLAIESCEYKKIDIRDWLINDDFATAVKEAEDKKAKPPACVADAAHRSVAVNDLFCASRIWGGGWGGQCTKVRLPDCAYCRLHKAELGRQGYLTHGRIDGPIPPKKSKEFEKWQAILQRRGNPTGGGANGSGGAMPVGPVLSEEGWRSMVRGAGESARAYEFRTGLRDETCGKSVGNKDTAKDVRKHPEISAGLEAAVDVVKDVAPCLRKRPASNVQQSKRLCWERCTSGQRDKNK